MVLERGGGGEVKMSGPCLWRGGKKFFDHRGGGGGMSKKNNSASLKLLNQYFPSKFLKSQISNLQILGASLPIYP